MARHDIIKTKANLQPDERALPYTIKSSEVANWIQMIFDGVTEKLAQQSGGKNAPHIEVSVIPMDASNDLDAKNHKGKNSEKWKSGFCPFILVMSKNVINKKQRQYDENMLSQFNVKSDDPSVQLIKEFYTVISGMTFSKADGNYIKSSSFRHEKNISRTNAEYVTSFRVPKVMKFGRNREVVTVLIDPVRIFWMMLRSVDDPKEEIQVFIEKYRQISAMDYEYRVVRQKVSKGSGKPKDLEEYFAKELSKFLVK